MRGRTDNLTSGERVDFYRRRRGMTQEVLADLVGHSADWVYRVENNRIELDRLSVIRHLAEVLDVSLGDLLGEPTLLDWTPDSGSRTVPALREALMDYQQITPALAGSISNDQPIDIDRLRLDVADAFDAYQSYRYGFVTHVTPLLLKRALHAVAATEGADHAVANGLLALTYQVAATACSPTNRPRGSESTPARSTAGSGYSWTDSRPTSSTDSPDGSEQLLARQGLTSSTARPSTDTHAMLSILEDQPRHTVRYYDLLVRSAALGAPRSVTTSTYPLGRFQARAAQCSGRPLHRPGSSIAARRLRRPGPRSLCRPCGRRCRQPAGRRSCRAARAFFVRLAGPLRAAPPSRSNPKDP